MEHVIDMIHRSQDRYLEELAQFLEIPSISTMAEHTEDVRRCAEWTAEALRQAGLRDVRLIETAGHPIVYGDWLGAGDAPSVLCYGHYDVQPVDPLGHWESAPFTPTIRDGNLYARGASDDKGQFFAHVKAIEAHLRVTGRLPVNLKVIVEGEEEVGGGHLDEFVRGHASLLAADVVVISDGAMFDDGVPSICCALRGLAYFQIDLRGTSTDLHSGSFGGAVVNPAFALAQILAQLKDGDGRITIPGFYDAVQPLTAADRVALAALPFDENKYRKGLGAPRLFGEAGYTTLERVGSRPTLDVNGLLAGFTGEGAKTVIPATAMAKVSMRLVPNQEAGTIGNSFEAYLQALAPATVDLRVTRLSGGNPWTADIEHRFVRAAGRALEKGFRARPVFIREGGSNPIVPTFAEVLRAPIVLFELGLPDDNPHAPNERLGLGQFQKGVVAAAHLYDQIARTDEEDKNEGVDQLWNAAGKCCALAPGSLPRLR